MFINKIPNWNQEIKIFQTIFKYEDGTANRGLSAASLRQGRGQWDNYASHSFRGRCASVVGGKSTLSHSGEAGSWVWYGRSQDQDQGRCRSRWQNLLCRHQDISAQEELCLRGFVWGHAEALVPEAPGLYWCSW